MQERTIDIEKEQIPDSERALIDLPLPAKRENAALGHCGPKRNSPIFSHTNSPTLKTKTSERICM